MYNSINLMKSKDSDYLIPVSINGKAIAMQEHQRQGGSVIPTLGIYYDFKVFEAGSKRFSMTDAILYSLSRLSDGYEILCPALDLVAFVPDSEHLQMAVSNTLRDHLTLQLESLFRDGVKLTRYARALKERYNSYFEEVLQ